MAKTAPKKTDQAEEKGTERKGTVHRVVDILAALAAVKTDIGVAELAKQVNLPFPTVHRLLHLLRTEDIVSWNEGTHRYSIGPELLRISSRVLSSFDIIKRAKQHMNEVRDVTGETVIFSLFSASNASMSFVSAAMGSHPLQYRFEMNTPLSLIYGASGKSILAFASDEQIEHIYNEEPDTSETGIQKPQISSLKDELNRVRTNGYSVTEGEKLVGARGIAAPVFDAKGVFGSFCITCPRERIPLDRVNEFAETIKRAASEFSHTLGGKQN